MPAAGASMNAAGGTPKPVERDHSGAQNQQMASDPARESAITERLSEMPESCRATYLKAARGKASPRVAIKAFCMECVCWDREEVRLCTAPACPLWMYRPFVRGGSDGIQNDPPGGCRRQAGQCS